MKKYVILTGGFIGDSHLFWRKGKAGYTSDINQAHLFTKEESESLNKSQHGRDEIYPFEDMKSISQSHVTQSSLNKYLKGKEVSHG